MNAATKPGSITGSSKGCSPDTPEHRRDRSREREPEEDGADHDDVLGQPGGSGPEDLAGEQLARRGGGDEQLHDAARLLLRDALGHPVAVGQDRHERQDDDDVGQQHGAAEVLLVVRGVGIGRGRCELGRREDGLRLFGADSGTLQAVLDRHRAGRLSDQDAGLIRGALVAEVIEGELVVRTARDRQQPVQLTGPHRLGGILGVLGGTDLRTLLAACLRCRRQRGLEGDDRVRREVARLVVDDDLRRLADAERAQERREAW